MALWTRAVSTVAWPSPWENGPAHKAFRPVGPPIPFSTDAWLTADSGQLMMSRRRCSRKARGRDDEPNLGCWRGISSPRQASVGSGLRWKKLADSEPDMRSLTGKEWLGTDGVGLRCSRPRRLDWGTMKSGRWLWCSQRKTTTRWTRLHDFGKRWLGLDLNAGGARRWGAPFGSIGRHGGGWPRRAELAGGGRSESRGGWAWAMVRKRNGRGLLLLCLCTR
jgi:hypothetical protein